MSEENKEEFEEEKNYDKKGKVDRKIVYKKKVCKFCQTNTEPSYKNVDALRRYTTERGKILPSRLTGTCSKHQRILNREIKRARTLSYLPFEKKF